MVGGCRGGGGGGGGGGEGGGVGDGRAGDAKTRGQFNRQEDAGHLS